MKKLFLGLMMAGLVACSHTAPVVSKDRAYQEHNTMATLYAKLAAENQALGYQAYNLAHMNLDMALKKHPKQVAVVTDLDETVLDNVEFQVDNILKDQSYSPESWGKWVSDARAGSIAGAVDFFKYANIKGVAIYYISNRKVTELEATLKNMDKLGIPYVKENVLFRDKDKSKEGRRQVVSKKYAHVLFLGDNLTDFSAVFEDKSVAERSNLVTQNKAKFGMDFIVLPNAMYGDWENALYDYNMKLKDSEKASKRLDMLKTLKK